MNGFHYTCRTLTDFSGAVCPARPEFDATTQTSKSLTSTATCSLLSLQSSLSLFIAQRFQMSKIPRPKRSWLDVFSQVFPSKFQQICIVSVSGDCMRYIGFQNLSNCCMHKCDPINFTNFLIKHFGGFFGIWNLCASVLAFLDEINLTLS